MTQPFLNDADVNVLLHPIDVDKMGIDLLSASAHKLYGPKGIGILYIRKGTPLYSTIHGGGQERHMRAGTEKPGIVGLGKAVEIAERDAAREKEKLCVLRDKLTSGILRGIEDSNCNGHPTERLPNNVNVSIAGIDGEAMLMELRLEGICASNGSACNSASVEPSHVLIAIGLPAESAKNALRFTLGKQTTEAEINRLLEVLPSITARLREAYVPGL